MTSLSLQELGELDPGSPLGQQWEKLVQHNPASGFMQSLPWARAKRRQGLFTLHLGLFEDEVLAGGAIFYTSQKRNGAGILIAPEGPVLPWEDESISSYGLGLIIDFIETHATELGVMSMRIEPHLVPPPIPALREFGRAPIDLVPRETLYIDLSLSEDGILAQMKPKGRYNIGLACRSGVQITHSLTTSTNQHIQCFYEVLTEASQRDDFALEPYQFFEHLVNGLSSAGLGRIFFAEHEGDILGALLLITYGARATYLYGGITNKKRQLMGGYALQWEAMKAAKDAGCTVYDFYGFNPFRAPEHHYARFSQFKSQFGGKSMRFMGAQDYFLTNCVADAFIKVVREVVKPSPIVLSAVDFISNEEACLK